VKYDYHDGQIETIFQVRKNTYFMAWHERESNTSIYSVTMNR